jgi:hypothetical protein
MLYTNLAAANLARVLEAAPADAELRRPPKQLGLSNAQVVVVRAQNGVAAEETLVVPIRRAIAREERS